MSAARAALGIDIGGNSIKLGLIAGDGSATILARTSVPTPAHGAASPLLAAIKVAGDGLFDQAKDRGVAVSGVGVSVAGFVDSARESMIYNVNIGELSGIPLRREVEKLFDRPTLIEVDSNAAAWGEYRHGAGRGTNRMLAITVGTGLGGGVVIDGRLLRHTGQCAGDIGHIIIDPDGPACACGARGCLEAFVGATGIERRSGRKTRTLILDAQAGDVSAIQALDETGAYIGLGLATLTHLFAPERIVVGGGVSSAGDLILHPIRRRFFERVAPFYTKDINILPAHLGNDAGIVGAADQALSVF